MCYYYVYVVCGCPLGEKDSYINLVDYHPYVVAVGIVVVHLVQDHRVVYVPCVDVLILYHHTYIVHFDLDELVDYEMMQEDVSLMNYYMYLVLLSVYLLKVLFEL